MPRENPWAKEYQRRKPVREEKTFTDRETGFSVKLCFEALEADDAVALGLAADRYAELAALWLARKKDGTLARQLPTSEGKPAQLSTQLLSRISKFITQQRPGMETDTWPAGEGPADVRWWYGIACLHRDLWDQISLWSMQIGEPEEGTEGADGEGEAEKPDPNAAGETMPTTAGSASP